MPCALSSSLWLPNTDASMSTPETPQQALDRITSQPDIMDVIFDHVASGGTAVDLAATWKVNWGKFSRWLFNDPDRLKVYSEALEARERYVIERAQFDLHSYIGADAADDELSPLKHSSKLKAIDMLFKKHGQYVDKTEHSGTIKLDEVIGRSWPKKDDNK